LISRQVSRCEQGSFADPGSGHLTPGSEIDFFRILDPGSQTHIFESLMTIFWVESSIILCKLTQIFFSQFKINIIFSFVIFGATKTGRTTHFCHPSLVAVFGSGIRDKHPGSATLEQGKEELIE
jgi:hypothetical protein